MSGSLEWHGSVLRCAIATERAGNSLDRDGIILAIVRAPVPVVAAVRGWAVGAGMSIVCACDVVVGGPSTRFRPGYPSIGFSPDGAMSSSSGRPRTCPRTCPRTFPAARPATGPTRPGGSLDDRRRTHRAA